MTEGKASRLSESAASILLTLLLAGCAAPAPGQSVSAFNTPSFQPVSAAPEATSSPPPSTTAAPTVPPTSSPQASSTVSSFLTPAAPPAGFDGGIACDGPIGERDAVALVDLDRTDATRYALRDYADVANPRTVCTFKFAPTALIDARHVLLKSCEIVELQPCVLAVVELPEVRYQWYRMPVPWDLSQQLVGIAPRIDSVAWISTNEDYTVRSVHITDATGDHIVADLAEAGGRCGSPDDSNTGGYTRDGSHVFVLDQPFAASNRLIVAEGHDLRFALVPTAGGWGQDYPAMALWAPTSATLFYRQGEDVMRWTPMAGAESFMTGVHWTSPSITPDGRHLAYAVPNGTGHDVYLMDLANPGRSRRIATGRGGPVFVNDRQLWYVDESTDGCVVEGKPRRLIYDIETGGEASSLIDSVVFIWPGTSSNH